MIEIPIIRPGEQPSKLYWIVLKRAIKSDGCSDVPDIYGHCCVGHDLCYRFGIDIYGNKVKKTDADAFLRRCMQRSSRFGRFSPVSWLYWAGVRWFGWKAYGMDVDERPEFYTYYWGK